MSQKETILAYCRRHGSISAKEAVGFGCFRLAARIHELRKMGYEFMVEYEEHHGGSHARYRLCEHRMAVA
jgi:hypothetical protein